MRYPFRGDCTDGRFGSESPGLTGCRDLTLQGRDIGAEVEMHHLSTG